MQVCSTEEPDVQSLRQSRDQLARLADSLPHSIVYQITHDSSGNRRFLYLSANAERIVGVTPEQAKTDPLACYRQILEPYQPLVLEAEVASAMNQSLFDVEVPIRTANGALKWLHICSMPSVQEDGQMVWNGIATDVTDRKRAEEALERARHQELQRHRAELAHVARLSLMGEMTAGLVHELNQPLHAVKSYARGSALRLLKLPQADEELLAALQQIGDEADRAAEIIRRVRRFVQKRELHSSELFVNRVVENVILLSKAEIDERRAIVALELGENLPAIVADPIQIEQVVMNLVRNGLEAMMDAPKDQRRLTIKTMLDGNDAVEVEVSDQGNGIDPDHMERVFEPFYTTKPEGMGMGLAISRSIIEAYRGRLWVSANPIRGCTFHFSLPVVTMP